MTTILLRTTIIYLILMIAMRLMGKRQIGELEVSELVTTLLISEVASLPITDADIPVTHAIIPIIVLLFFEISTSLLTATFPRIKNILTARPSTLIRNGKLCERTMRSVRISADELIGELRQQGVTDPSEVLYAILEQNGKITVIQKAPYRVPNSKQLGVIPREDGICHIVIDKGVINKYGLHELGLTESDIKRRLNSMKLDASDIYLMMINDSGKIYTVKREVRRGKRQ